MGTKALLPCQRISATYRVHRTHEDIRRIFASVLQDYSSTSWMPFKHRGGIIDLTIDDDPAALPCIVFLDFLVRNVIRSGFARFRGLVAWSVKIYWI